MNDEDQVGVGVSESSSEITKLSDLLRKVGYQAKLIDDFPGVLTSTSGVKIGVFTYTDAIQLSCGFNDSGSNVEFVNSFNKSFRFSKLFLEEDGSLNLVSDHFFEYDRPEAADVLEAIMMSFDRSLARFRESYSQT